MKRAVETNLQPTVPQAQRYAKLVAGLAGRTLPCALVDLDAFDRNLAAMAKRAGGKPIRLASKSLRVPALMRRALAYGPAYAGVLCYSVAEAVSLAEQGMDDLLVAYPTCQPAFLNALAQAIGNGRHIVAMADCEQHLAALQAAADRAGTLLEIAFDLDMSFDLPGLHFGVYRSPLNTPDKVMALYAKLMAYPRLRLVGVMGYEAQIAGVGDAVPGKWLENQAVHWLKAWSTPKVAARRKAMVAALRQAGAPLRIVNGGGTGSLESTAADPSVTELGAGSGLYAPVLFDHYRGFQHEPAAFFALEASRSAFDGSLTCQGGGYVASGAVGVHKLPEPVWPIGLQLLGQEGAGEVQTPLFGQVDLALGDRVLFRPAKAGEFLDRFDSVLLQRDGQVVEQVPTYRGMGWQFF
ncbi:alanine racemase [Chitinimonas sp. BJB300]|uniref:alanine racemase n=1 Tax=Chitinimonas sp. BJB300 TaxID=1559339 RepID=UPI000C102CD9|nr:alanine racemase [Chitinimonas sp. BJB300]PHV10606.1 amino acid aldolase [Chitinimonas sp. BJB300]TSJ86075.1 amino acid deaminase/aldolase [Chitinimonas sp. BJB300]